MAQVVRHLLSARDKVATLALIVVTHLRGRNFAILLALATASIGCIVGLIDREKGRLF